MIFRKKGLRIEISPLFFIITSTLLLIDDSGYMAYSLLFSLCHEFGHLLMMYLLKKPPHYISVKYYGLEICASSFNYLEAILISLSEGETSLLRLLSYIFDSPNELL